jgi:hypothetical protein
MSPAHIKGLSVIAIAKAQAELHRLTGAEPSISIEDATLSLPT